MIGPDLITIPARIGTVVRDFGPIFIWSGLWFEVNRYQNALLSENFSKYHVPRTVLNNFATIYRTSDRTRTEPKKITDQNISDRTGSNTDRWFDLSKNMSIHCSYWTRIVSRYSYGRSTWQDTTGSSNEGASCKTKFKDGEIAEVND